MEVSAQQIHVSYGANTILKDVSIHAGKQEVIGLIGSNGSGKSTLLKCLYRILQPTTGCIWLDGEQLESLSYKESAQKLAVVAQHNHYSFDFSVHEVVLMGRSPHKNALQRDNISDYKIVANALAAVGMSAFAKRSFKTLSGGEQQRVILARALAQQTPCLILDEPTNHLDITHQLQLLRMIKTFDITVIAAIHDLNIAAMFCDRIFVLKDGEIIGQGTPREVLTKAMIKMVYQVESEIVEDRNGQLHVLFL